MGARKEEGGEGDSRHHAISRKYEPTVLPPSFAGFQSARRTKKRREKTRGGEGRHRAGRTPQENGKEDEPTRMAMEGRTGESEGGALSFQRGRERHGGL